MADNIISGVYPPHFDKYISLVENDAMNSILEKQAEKASEYFNSMPQEKWSYKYAENKWTVKEVLQHITDTERVFSFRALAFSRKDSHTLPSFDENEYASNSNANNRTADSLIEEFLAVRKSTGSFFDGLSSDQLNYVGKASNYEMSVNAIGYMIAGHFAHHMKILKEKYFPG
jgi:uncharacterized damage-inducible protein DinB